MLIEIEYYRSVLHNEPAAEGLAGLGDKAGELDSRAGRKQAAYLTDGNSLLTDG